jgi:hypothetical protein
MMDAEFHLPISTTHLTTGLSGSVFVKAAAR